MVIISLYNGDGTNTRHSVLGTWPVGWATTIFCSTGGVPATIENVANESYPFRRPLNFVTKGKAKGIVKDFIDFVISKEGQKIVNSLEFIPILGRGGGYSEFAKVRFTGTSSGVSGFNGCPFGCFISDFDAKE